MNQPLPPLGQYLLGTAIALDTMNTGHAPDIDPKTATGQQAHDYVIDRQARIWPVRPGVTARRADRALPLSPDSASQAPSRRTSAFHAEQHFRYSSKQEPTPIPGARSHSRERRRAGSAVFRVHGRAAGDVDRRTGDRAGLIRAGEGGRVADVVERRRPLPASSRPRSAR